ncbi:glycosyltransferase family 2 protein [Mucilaginibacter sp. UR6-1]|uniref:glycosyltransferase family 2 protein n=1 Tax=Mucilaginibacter sp. UR6-1 TaxID=1435643 RepID=UPI001E60CB50|nr:glycosyltransferase family A protein [Mucilaginibacter sp. UR6-1]MCC8409600.1 glycosyltransferase family 2 protein [Mucilaginibacter sp. UR6-1]
MKFSVIIPTYNRPDFLREALASVAAQTYSNYEVVVVNDHKPDEDIVNKVCSEFNNVKVIHHEVSMGGNAARNTGIKQSDGALIAFLDDDDLWLPTKLEEHFKAHQAGINVGLVYSDCILFSDESDKTSEAKRDLPADVLNAMRQGDFCPITTTCVTVTKQAIEESGLFDEQLISFQDWDMWFRIAHKYKFAHVAKSLIKFREHFGVRTSKSIDKRLKGLSQVVQKWKSKVDMSAFKSIFLRRTYYFYACDLIATNNRLKAVSYSFKLLNPVVLSIDSVKRFIKVLVGVMRPARASQQNL